MVRILLDAGADADLQDEVSVQMVWVCKIIRSGLKYSKNQTNVIVYVSS